MLRMSKPPYKSRSASSTNPNPAVAKSKRRPKHDVSSWIVTDDWPDEVPITEAEIEVFERYFGDVFDEMFSPIDLIDRSKP